MVDLIPSCSSRGTSSTQRITASASRRTSAPPCAWNDRFLYLFYNTLIYLSQVFFIPLPFQIFFWTGMTGMKKIQVALKSPSDSEKHSPGVLHNGWNPPPVDRAGSHPKKHRNDNQCCSSVHVFKTMHNHWEPHFEVSVLLDRWGYACTPTTQTLANGSTPSLPFHRAHFH